MCLDPVLQDGDSDLQRQDKNEDQHEADDGSDQILLGLLSRVLLIRLGDLHSKEDAVDGADRDDYGNRRSEYAVEYLQYRLDHRMEIDVGQYNRAQIFSSFCLFYVSYLVMQVSRCRPCRRGD